jgi:hypothetical protein
MEKNAATIKRVERSNDLSGASSNQTDFLAVGRKQKCEITKRQHFPDNKFKLYLEKILHRQ